jgi:hypothetical protein
VQLRCQPVTPVEAAGTHRAQRTREPPMNMVVVPDDGAGPAGRV